MCEVVGINLTQLRLWRVIVAVNLTLNLTDYLALGRKLLVIGHIGPSQILILAILS